MVAADNSNQRRAERLGMPFGTANGQLRKSIIMFLAQRLGMDICFKCKDKIETLEEWSIEHKVAWFNSEDPITTFFDVNNIAFSHIVCNRPETPRPVARHGTRYKYDYHNCRCDDCKSVHSRHMKKRIRRASVNG